MPNLAKVADDERERELARELAERVAKEKEEHRKTKAEKMEDALQRYDATKITAIELENELLAIDVEYGVDEVLVLSSDDEAEFTDSQSVSAMVLDDEMGASPVASVRCAKV
jgi:hypothetical protein